ncbi:hypothetical protein [Nonomuraea sp. NPDC049709]
MRAFAFCRAILAARRWAAVADFDVLAVVSAFAVSAADSLVVAA